MIPGNCETDGNDSLLSHLKTVSVITPIFCATSFETRSNLRFLI